MFPQILIDVGVLAVLFFTRIGLPIGLTLAVGFWLERKLHPRAEAEAATAAAPSKPTLRLRIAQEFNALPAWLPAIFMVLMIGLVAAAFRLMFGLGEATNLSQAYPWGLWIGFDLFMVAFSGGAFTLATLVYVLNMHQFHAAIRPTVLTGLLGYSSVLVILMMDLGRWDRFYHFMIYPNLNSALFEVSWCIMLYTTVLFMEFSPIILQRFKWTRAMGIIRKLTIVFAILGATLSTLHQSSLGTLFIVMSQRVHPLWYTEIMPLLFFLSSIVAGLAMVIAGATVSYWVFKRSLDQKLVGGLARFVPWVLAVYLLVRLGDLFLSGKGGMLLTSGGYSVLYLAELAFGFVLPGILFSLKRVRASRALSLVAGANLLLGIFMNRFDVAWFSMSPVPGYSYFPSLTEIAIQAGVLAGVILVYTIVGHYFPLFEGTMIREKQKEAVKEEVLQPGRAY